MNFAIKCAFGNHDSLLRFMNPNKKYPPLIPIMYRSYAYSDKNSDGIYINAYSKHRAILHKTLKELVDNYTYYYNIRASAIG